jgi:hypothetical protein
MPRGSAVTLVKRNAAKMEVFLLVVEGLIWIIDVIAMTVDVYSWFKGKENRVQRREARKAGVEIPPRDRWNRRVIILTTIVILSTVALLVWKA